MASKTLVSDPKNPSYEAGANWVGGVAPVAGDTVTIQTLYQGGPAPLTATGVAFVDQQISLTQDGNIAGGLEVAGGSSFDAQTSVTGSVDGNVLDLNGTFTTAGTITNVNINIVSGSGQNVDTNTGTINYNRAPISDPAFGIDTGDTSASFINDGVINVTNQPGGQLTGGTAFPTDVMIATPFSGSGVVNITGDQPNTTAPAPYVGSQAQVTISSDSPVTGTNTFNLNDGELIVSSTTTGTLTFQDSSGLLNFTGAPVINTGLDIVGFRAGDIIGLGSAEVKKGTLKYNATTGVLSFTDVNSGSEVSLQITPTGSQSYTTASFQEETGIGDFTSSESIVTTAAAPCYCAGTLIRTDKGEVAVEALCLGDQVVLAQGGTCAVTWIGQRRLDCRHHPRPAQVMPIRVEAGAFGPGLPARDLLLSPDHSVYLHGVLMPIHLLLNGATIRRESVARVHYFHVELERHEVLLAEGLPVESYLDTGNRTMFENGAKFLVLHPDFAPLAWDHACAPLHLAGAMLDRTRHDLAARVANRGFVRSFDPDLHLLVGDRRLAAAAISGQQHRFLVPAGVREVVVASRDFVPDAGDRRLLGVAVGGIAANGRAIDLDGATPGAGFHLREKGWRWTDGAARLSLPPATGPVVLELLIAATGCYWIRDTHACPLGTRQDAPRPRLARD